MAYPETKLTLDGKNEERELPSPTREETETPVFNALFDLIKTWDIGTPEQYGYCGGNGSHVKLIIDALLAAGINLSKDGATTVCVDLLGGTLSQAIADRVIQLAAGRKGRDLINIELRQVNSGYLPHLIVDPGDVVHILVAELRRKEYELAEVTRRLKGETS